MSVIESKRILPCKTDNECTQEYLTIPGDIRNNTWNSTYSQWDAPKIYGLDLCPRPFPTKSQNPNYYCEGIDCDVRLHPIDLDTPVACAGDSSDPSDDNVSNLYFLPSLAFGVKNLLDNSLNCIPPAVAKEYLTGDGKICPNEKSVISCVDGRSKSVYLTQDGILAAVYTISLFGTERDQYGRPQYEYVICPYTGGQNIFDIALGEPSDIGRYKEIQGTQPFCLGTKTNPCVCVSLLLHGNLEKADPSDPSSVDPSDPSGIQTGLFWVGVKLFYTNADGKMCVRNPECLNITNVPNSAFASCFTPYFAKAKDYIVPGNINVLKPVCGQQTGNTKCWNPNGQSQGTVYLGCGLTQQTTYCENDILHVIEISPQVSLSDILTNGDYGRCSIYIVLLPVLNKNTLRR